MTNTPTSPTTKRSLSSHPTLFELDAEWSSLERLLDELEEEDLEQAIANALSEGIVNPEEAATMVSTALFSVKEKATQKINSFCLWVRTLEEKAEAWKRHADQIRDRAKTTENQIKRLKRVLHWFMNRHNLSRVDGRDFRVSAYYSGAHPQLKDRVAPEDLPAELVKVTVTVSPNWDAIRERLKADDPEISKWVQWGERSPAIRISKAKAKE